MTLYFQSTKNNGTVYTMQEGMDEATILQLMADIGHSNIQSITEQAYLTATAII